jgi:membrane AbrB-like protein
VLAPLIVAATVDLTGVGHGAQAPDLVQSAAFLVIGLQVGLSFTVESLKAIGRALPLALTIILGLIVASAGLGLLMARWVGVGALDGYLATTPGGLYAVLALASDTGADATFVLAVQVLRLLVMLFTAPLLARWLRRSGAG